MQNNQHIYILHTHNLTHWRKDALCKCKKETRALNCRYVSSSWMQSLATYSIARVGTIEQSKGGHIKAEQNTCARYSLKDAALEHARAVEKSRQREEGG